MAIVTLAVAKTHLRIAADDTAHDADIQLKLNQAEVIIVRYLKNQNADADGNVAAAILLMTASLYEMRGDDQTRSEQTWTAIERLLVGLRDPALA